MDIEPTPPFTCDLLVVGGGINGAGIARDAAGRGLSVVLCDKDDLAQHTSSASTKLVHGGLRYLEHYELGLVRKSLLEREVLLRAAPHIISPLRFVLPHAAGQRPAWMLRAGLFLYDHLARRRILPGSAMTSLVGTEAGAPLKPSFRRAFEYSDGWVDDTRLVILNAVDAAEHGARILTRTRCTSASASAEGWRATLCDERGRSTEVRARALVNAAGPWAGQVVREVLGRATTTSQRLVKGSHLVVPKLFDHGKAYLFQNPDRRIIFAIPFQERFTLIGTTDVEFSGDLDRTAIEREEVEYLCAMANRYFERQIGPADVVWSYAGVRPLLGDEASSASDITRDYRLEFERDPAPLLNVWGGKLTTYRKLAEEAMALLLPALGLAARPWTATAPLPGGDLGEPGRVVPDADFGGFLARFRERWPWLPAPLALRYARTYGTRAERFLSGARDLAGLGEQILPDLYAAEARHLVAQEWARTADDILWRRTKLGLGGTAEERGRLEAWLAAEAARPRSLAAPPPRAAAGARHARLELREVSKSVGDEPHLYPMTLCLEPGHINVLLGATQAGKTSLLRILAGLDKPTRGRLLENGVDVGGVEPRRRDLAMVFQQFINYPAMTVFENIASPLRLQRRPAPEIRSRVQAIAEKLHIEHLLDRLPRELSGGQQQRTALARALAKGAGLVLLDEPLVNLDYKLREELRAELAALFSGGEATVVYATTEPQEALLLGGYTAVLDRGRLLQYGPTLDVYRNPATVAVASAFSDPPMNVVDGTVLGAGGIRLADGATLPLGQHAGGRGGGLAPGSRCLVGLRPNHLRLAPGGGATVEMDATVELAELSGSETLLHLRHASVALVAQLPGVHTFALGSTLKTYLDPSELLLFDAQGALVAAPREAAHGQD